MTGVMQAVLAFGVRAAVSMGGNRTLTSTGGAGAGNAQLSAGNTGGFVGTVSPGGVGAFSSSWVLPTYFAGAGYDIRTTVTGGAFTLDPSAGSFISLGTSRLWTKVGAATVTATMEIRDAVSLVVLDTITISLTGS